MPFNPFASSDRPSARPASSTTEPVAPAAAAPEPQAPAAASDPADDWAAAWAFPSAEPEPAPPAVVPEPEPEPMPEPPADAGEPVAETVVSEPDAGARADDPPSDPEPEWMSAALGFDEPDAAALWEESVADPTPESEPDPEPGAPAWVDAAREYEGAGPAASSPAGEPAARPAIRVDAAAFDWAMPDDADAVPRAHERAETPEDVAADDADADGPWGAADDDREAASDDPWDLAMVADAGDEPGSGRAFPTRIVLTVAAVIAAVALIVAGVLGVRRLVDVRAQRDARESACATLADAVDRWDGLVAQADSLGVAHDGRPAGRECPTDTGKAARAAESYDKASDALESLVSDAIGDQWAAIGDALSKALDANPDMSVDTRTAIGSLLGSDAPATADDLAALREKADALAGQAAEQQTKADEENRAAEEERKAEEERRAAEEAQQQAGQQQAQTPQYAPPRYTPSYTPQYTPQTQPQTPAPQPEPSPEPSGSADVTM